MNHIFPNTKKLNEHRCFNKILSLFPKNLKNHILFCYIKNQIIFFVTDHPAIKMEINYNKKLINELLNIAKKNFSECKELDIREFKVFVSNKIVQNKKETKPILYYSEKSNGDFIISTNFKELKDIFEKIKSKIKENKKK
ncbi:hypothetical protein [Nitrosophilus kaiyonis]|uniref:hypothetical protein n=1 Tax=Nitrosophilus kaiyonis TaxID=2930200 RepID=UPI00249071ED|nr:hypothetical protein [Nitrosophilus kaiyonis]